MFGFKKKERKPLWIKAKDVMELIRSDYEANMSFVFQDQIFQDFDEFQANACINGIRISELEEPIEVVRAGIIGNDTMLKTPWGETRLAKMALR
ncbi:MAG: hypothetical protein ACOX8M_06735 [Marvinbryantia sp.]|jgi:hypothetical protein